MPVGPLLRVYHLQNYPLASAHWMSSYPHILSRNEAYALWVNPGLELVGPFVRISHLLSYTLATAHWMSNCPRILSHNEACTLWVNSDAFKGF